MSVRDPPLLAYPFPQSYAGRSEHPQQSRSECRRSSRCSCRQGPNSTGQRVQQGYVFSCECLGTQEHATGSGHVKKPSCLSIRDADSGSYLLILLASLSAS